MANEKFLNQTGLAYYHDRAKTVFDNKIEKIKVNGTEQTITNKEVNLPTAVDYDYDTSLLKVATGGTSGAKLEIKQSASIRGYDFTKTNLDSGYSDTITLASTDYVDTNGGKIDKIKVNGVEQTITNKEVDLPVPNVTAGDKSISVNVPDNSKGFYLEQKFGGVEFGGTHADGDFGTVILTDKTYVDGKGSIAIDSTSNNKTTFTVGSNTSSIATSPDGIIYTEGATATEVPSKAYVDDAIAGVTGMEFVLVDTLPTEGEKGKIYLVDNGTAGSNIKDEYIWIQDGANGRFERIGSTDIDLSAYWAKTELTAITTAEIDALFA